jgi:hypothetical protein
MTFESELDELLRRLDSSPYVHTERRSNTAVLRVQDAVIGSLNLATRALSVDVPADKAAPLLQRHEQLRETKGGVRIDVTDLESRTAAEALLRWRVELERFAPQLLAASP